MRLRNAGELPLSDNRIVANLENTMQDIADYAVIDLNIIGLDIINADNKKNQDEPKELLGENIRYQWHPRPESNR